MHANCLSGICSLIKQLSVSYFFPVRHYSPYTKSIALTHLRKPAGAMVDNIEHWGYTKYMILPVAAKLLLAQVCIILVDLGYMLLSCLRHRV